MSKKVVFMFLVVLLLVLVSSVATAVAQDKPPLPGLAPQCVEVFDHPKTPYMVVCKDDDMTKYKVKEVGVTCAVELDANAMQLVVTPNSNQLLRRPGPSKAYLIWWVYDADGNVTSGFYTP